MKSLLYFQSTATTSARRKFDGICYAARKHGWLVQRFDLHDPIRIREEIMIWHPVGCVIECAADDLTIPLQTLSLVPTVLLDCNPDQARRRISSVCQHPVAIGQFAAQHLLDMNLASYAYAKWPERKFWDRMRGRSFCRAVREARKPLFQIETGGMKESVTTMHRALSVDLAKLPKPAGIYCVNDAIAVQVLEVAHQLNIPVPHDLVILGTDNEEPLCENTTPMISSVELDFVRAGQRCVEIIADHLVQGTMPRREHFGPLRIVQRASTRRAARQDAHVVAALDLIRLRATSGIKPQEVVNEFPCSRRMAEIRFRAVTGHSILDEIHAVQIEHAKRLLENRNLKLTLIPALCGYDSNPFFMKLFHRKTGFTLNGWRQTLNEHTPS
jgi:LacI family transcriptional regulator